MTIGDRQMKQDAQPGGKLDRLMEATNREYEVGKSLPFPNLIPTRVAY